MNQLLQHKGVRWITFGWTAFIAENVVMSHNREWIIAQFGDGTYHNAYNTLSSAACLSIAWGYLRHGRFQGPRIVSAAGPGRRAAGLALQSLGLVGFAQLPPKLQIPVALGGTAAAPPIAGAASAAATPAPPAPKIRARCPIDFTPADVPSDGVYGLKRVTRHPTLWSMAFVGAGIAVASPFATHIVMFGMPAVLATIGGAHQDYRFRRGWGGELTPEVDAKTSNIPFLALLSGDQQWSALRNELKPVNSVLAVLLCATWRLRPAALQF